MKKLLTVGILALCSFTIAVAGNVRISTKSYDITFSSITKVGNALLKAGQYTVKVDGNNAVFTDESTAKSFTVPAKVENTEKKFNSTRVDANTVGDTDVVTDIELGGSKTKLEFGEF
jgi:translation elongation factor P/translation initiation factor 5A